MNKKILMFITLGILLVSFASAISSLEPVKQGECVELFQFCDDCTYVNLTTVSHPNGTRDTSLNEQMTKNNQNFNYTYCNAQENGNYFYIVCGDKNGSYKCEEISFKVTPNGKDGTDNIIFFLLIILLLYGITFIGFFNRISLMTTLGGMAMLFLGIYMIKNGILIFRDNLTNYISYITIAIGGGLSLWAIIEEFQENM